MGYCIDVYGDLTIREEKIPLAIDCLKKLMYRGLNERCGPHGFSWVSSDNVISFLESDYDEKRKLKCVLREFRYGFEDENDDLLFHYFLGEKWGDDEVLWETLAPAVDNGSMIEYRGEDGHRWRFLFEDGSVKEQNAVITWE
jgi:hypothetical protein